MTSRLCEAVCWVTMPDDRSERFRGQCDYMAKYIRDGRYVCGQHLKVKVPEYVRESEYKARWGRP